MNTLEEKGAASPSGTRPCERAMPQSEIVSNGLGAAALLALQPDLSRFYNRADLDRLAREYSQMLLSSARVRAAEWGI